MLQVTRKATSYFQQARQAQRHPDSAGVRIFTARDENGLVRVTLAFAEQPQDGDQVTETGGAPVFVAPELAESLASSVVDVVQNDHGTEVVITESEHAAGAFRPPTTRVERPRIESDDLERRIAALEDERDVQATMYRYGHSIDYGLEEEWLDCFTPDGVLQIRRAGPMATRHAGRAQLAEFAAAHTRAPEYLHKHALVEPRIVVDGDHATATSYWFRLDLLAEGPVVRSFGRYHDRFVRCDDGIWRLEERINEHETSRPLPIRVAWT